MIKKYDQSSIMSVAVLFFLCIFSYSNSLTHGFLLDDHLVLLNQVGSGGNSWVDVLTKGMNGFYRPLGFLFLELLYAFFGKNPTGYNLVNLMLYFFICVLFLFIVDLLYAHSQSCLRTPPARDRVSPIAFIAACLYCVHPINNMIVNYKTASMLAVFIICSQLSFMLFLIYSDKGSKFCYWGSLLFYLCALFSHEVSSILPAYILFFICFLKNIKLKKIIYLLSPYLACFVFFIFVRSHINHLRPIDTLFHLHISLGLYVATVSDLIIWYLSKLFLPYNLLFIWDVPIIAEHILSRILVLLFVIISSMVLFLILIRSKKRLELFSLTLFLIGFIPAGIAAFTYSSLLKTAIIEPHWFYFCSIGFFMLIARVFLFIGENFNKTARNLIFGLVIVILVTATRESNVVWKDEATYCTYWIKLNPLNYTPREAMLLRPVLVTKSP